MTTSAAGADGKPRDGVVSRTGLRLARLIAPDSLGAAAVLVLFLFIVGAPFDLDSIRSTFSAWEGAVPWIPRGLLYASALLLGFAAVLMVGDAAPLLAALFVAAHLRTSGALLSQSRLPIWEILGIQFPAPRFGGDGAAMLFLVVFGAWAFAVLMRFQTMRDALSAAGAEGEDVARLSFVSLVSQVGAIAILGGALSLVLAVVP